MNQLHVILNPYANRGSGYRRTRRQLVQALEQMECPFSIIETTAKADAEQMAKDVVAQGVEIVAAVGGDGTIHEVGNGLMASAAQQPLPKLAIFPVGTANDLAMALSLPRRMKAIADAIMQGHTRRIDVGLVTYRTKLDTEDDDVGSDVGHEYFVNNVGIGLEASITQQADKLKRLRGPLLYLVAALQSLWAYAPTDMSIQWGADGMLRDSLEEYSGRALMITVGNGQRAGGGFYLTPDARLDDGLLDAGVLENVPKGQLVRLLLKARSGAHVNDPAVTMLRSPRIQIKAKQGVPIHADGEVLAYRATEIELSIATRQLGVVVPKP